MVRDRVTGVFTRPERVRAVRRAGPHHPLDAIHLAEPLPQRTPVLYQAGSSPRGRAFAARHAECVFVSGRSPQLVAPRAAAICALAAEQGRPVIVFAMLTAILGETEALARARHAEYLAHVSHEVGRLLVPELQRRGRFKQGYAPGTLREKLFDAGPTLPPSHPAAASRAWPAP